MTARLVPYTPIQKMQGYDLRLLSPHPVASITYQRRDEGFLALGAYLSGANAERKRCIETQPVMMTHDPSGSGTKRMHIYVVVQEDAEAELSRGDEEEGMLKVPTPLNEDIMIEVAGGELIAALRFEGNATRERTEMARQELISHLEKDNLNLGPAELKGLFRLAQYGPLHSLTTRVNEIWLGVDIR